MLGAATTTSELISLHYASPVVQALTISRYCHVRQLYYTIHTGLMCFVYTCADRQEHHLPRDVDLVLMEMSVDDLRMYVTHPPSPFPSFLTPTPHAKKKLIRRQDDGRIQRL